MNNRPYVSPVRQAAAQRTRARILDAAAEIIAGPQGLAGLSMEAAAKAAGVARITVYKQFGSRRGLLESVFDRAAERGGLHRLREAMALPEPRAALGALMAIFCGFFASEGPVLVRLYAAEDAELGEALTDRNERRRRAIGVLVDRMTDRGEVRPEERRDLADLLFMLTSFASFHELTRDGRTPEAACALLRAVARDALNRAAPPF